MRVNHKVVPTLAVPQAGTKCHVFVLDMYVQNLPEEAIIHDNFYVQPCRSFQDDTQSTWFTALPMGKNSLGKMVKSICSDAGISGQKMNHSLRATGASNLYHAGVRVLCIL